MEEKELIRAAYFGELVRVQALVQQSVGLDKEEALKAAAGMNHLAVVRYLAEQCSADVTSQDEFGCTALMLAAKHGHLEVVQYLAGKWGAEVDAEDSYGCTALIRAAQSGHVEVVRYLAEECGADVEASSHKALMLAARFGKIEVVRYLVEQRGTDTDTRNKGGWPALMWAASNSQLDVVRYLAELCGADVNAKNNEGETALMRAAKQGKVEVVRCLVEQCHADVNLKDKAGNTAVRLAVERGYHEIKRILTPYVAPATPSHASGATTLPSSLVVIPPLEVELISVSSPKLGGNLRAKWLDADVFVKLFVPDASYSRFEDEVVLWQRLRHPNVLKMYGACAAGPPLQFFVCENASNGSLLELKQPTKWKYLHEAALGLEYLHERGVVHGDLRCGNILIGSDSLAKLSNFGLSSPMKSSSQVSSEVLGGMRWQAPEVVLGEPLSSESDVYSLGMCVLEAETGKIPWGELDEHWVKAYKTTWKPETGGGSSWYAPDCPAGDARELVWRMCSQDPRKRASLSAVVCELERLATKESAEHSQPELEPADILCEYEYGKIEELWLKLQEHMQKLNNDRYCRVFDDLEKVHDCLHESTRNSTLVARFQALLSELYETVKMPPEQARMMRLSSTRVTATSFYSIQWRIESLMASLGLRGFEDSTEREARWQQQQQNDVGYFVSGVSDTFLLLQELKTKEERSAFLRNLQAEVENRAGKYTSAQLEVMRNAYEKIAGGLETDHTSELTPEWFLPWYELVVDEWNCLGEGGFGSVFRAKWLDSDVVVKRVTLAGSSFKLGASTTIDSNWLASEDPSVSQVEENANKRAEAVAMFRREVDIWFGLSHPHVIRLFGACHVGRPFFVCEYATHGTLVSYLRQHPDELWSKLHEAALGVQYLHARGVVHGDLKGNNIVIGSDMKAKVTDFGLSSVASGECKTLVSGAWNWVAPELLDTDERPTFATDVYSLGMCVVEALRVVEAVTSDKASSHCLPWRVGDRAAVKYHATRGTLPSRPAICEESQWELVVRMCELEPDKRVKISTVVDELARLAYPSTTTRQAVELTAISTVTWKSIPQAIAAAQQLLASVQCDGTMISQYYALLWESIEQIRGQIQDDEAISCGDGDKCRAAFCSLVAASRESTVKLRERKSGIVSLAETTMRCFALQRRLVKLCEAYFLDRGAPGQIVEVHIVQKYRVFKVKEQ